MLIKLIDGYGKTRQEGFVIGLEESIDPQVPCGASFSYNVLAMKFILKAKASKNLFHEWRSKQGSSSTVAVSSDLIRQASIKSSFIFAVPNVNKFSTG